MRGHAADALTMVIPPLMLVRDDLPKLVSGALE
jgi:hypothetical protein